MERVLVYLDQDSSQDFISIAIYFLESADDWTWSTLVRILRCRYATSAWNKYAPISD
jgi:hypothetical protein